MEGFLREHLKFMVCLWDKIWPPLAPPGTLPTSNGPPSTSNLNGLAMITVLYDFEARDNDELTVRVGEELCKVGDEGDYILARKLTGTMDMGLVPSNYVTPSGFINPSVPDSPQSPIQPRPLSEFGSQNSLDITSQPWYIEVPNRSQAETLLLANPNAHGSYLVRPSDTNHGQYSLSVRNENKVTHFRIHNNSSGEYYLQQGRTFSTLKDLLNFHKTNWKLLRCPLLQPCVPQIEPLDDWERPRSEFTLLKKLGQGFFGEVHEGLWKGRERVAIKTFKQEHLNRSDFDKEIIALKTLCHRNLIGLLAVCSLGEPVYIVTELMTKGNLQEYLKGLNGKHLKYADILHIVSQVADGMEYLEKKHVVHRDLATRNVLVGESLVCKIADFGLARLLKDDLYSPESNRTIPIRWTAPEALAYCTYSTKSDVWSFGVLVYEVYTFGDTPYKGWNNKDVYAKVFKGYRLPQPPNCTNEMYNVMMTCWKESPKDRPSFQELVETLTSIERTLR
ncbi:tyrosine-protein kinase Srms-like [Hyperolius riggenbachi]|uniref:tyrosine-protein kinase Srms-like n=1 Tax=Hyperolius riggenbachi TaxID=752182 RepID=UPI0035A364AD